MPAFGLINLRHAQNHSEVPEADEDWPTLYDIIGFRNGVRSRLLQLYEDLANGKQALTRNVARTLVMTLEHEGFHVEVGSPPYSFDFRINGLRRPCCTC